MKHPLGLAILAATLVALAGSAPLQAIPPYEQLCPPGWTGPNCDEPLSSCSPNPCNNGSCVDEGGGAYRCECNCGWQGTNCNMPITSGATHSGMTWNLISQYSATVAHVGADSGTNAYAGDTSASASLPILCLYVDNSAPPSGLTPNFYNGWSKGHLALTPPFPGTMLTSLSVADGYCSCSLGSGWRMAEFHDGWYGPGLTSQGGWSYLGYGVISSSTRFWVYINDQLANPWN